MKTSIRKPKPGNSKIRGNHQPKKGPVLIYFILFVVVGITMTTLNQVRKKRLEADPAGTVQNRSSSSFVKEGELQFYSGDGEKITAIDIEIADDDVQTQRGLMYRRTLKQNQGMLFIFPDEEDRSFWMKNTLISLDIMYLNANKEIVSIAENAPPKSEQSIWSEGPAKYVVEVNAGFAAQYGIKPGDKIEFRRSY